MTTTSRPRSSASPGVCYNCAVIEPRSIVNKRREQRVCSLACGRPGAVRAEGEHSCHRLILLRGDTLERFEAILHFAANSSDIAIVHQIDVGVAHDLVLFDRPLEADIVRKPHRQRAQL